MTEAERINNHIKAAIESLERIALDFPTAGRGIERVLAMDLAPARDALESMDD